jgi:hypothetical protein
VKSTLERLSPLSETPSIYFHYSAKFSRDDQAAILEAARAVRPKGTYSFVWINTQHNVRFYDRASDGDGSMGRGSYVITSPAQIYQVCRRHRLFDIGISEAGGVVLQTPSYT